MYAGAGLHVIRPATSVSTGFIPNNGLIVSASDGVRLDCISNSSNYTVGEFTTPNMSMLVSPESSDPYVTLKYPHNRPGVIRLLNKANTFPSEGKGIYTCNIPDSNEKTISINVGIYPHEFIGIKLHINWYIIIQNVSPAEPPTITNLTYHKETRSLSCISSVSPATRVVWMRDGVPLTTDGSSHYSLSQTVSHRPTSTYHNVLMIDDTAPGVAGNYTCNVSNDLGSHSMSVVAIGELQWHIQAIYRHTCVSAFLSCITGLTITGLESYLTVGESADISCIINEPVSFIQWRNMSHSLSRTTTENVTVLNYTIPLVKDDMQGQIYTCVAHSGNITDTQTTEILAEGRHFEVLYV